MQVIRARPQMSLFCIVFCELIGHHNLEHENARVPRCNVDITGEPHLKMQKKCAIIIRACSQMSVFHTVLCELVGHHNPRAPRCNIDIAGEPHLKMKKNSASHFAAPSPSLFALHRFDLILQNSVEIDLY